MYALAVPRFANLVPFTIVFNDEKAFLVLTICEVDQSQQSKYPKQKW